MPGTPTPSAELRRGRRALEGLHGLELLEDLRYEVSSDSWLLSCRLRVAAAPGSPIPAASDWYLVVGPSYPFGAVGFYPALVGGIVTTFPHQLLNQPPLSGRPYRQGLLCLTRNTGALRLRADEEEPFDAARRLRWHGQRALRWLDAAAAGRLNQPGDPFDLPVLPSEYAPELIYAANEDSLNWVPPKGLRYGTLDTFVTEGAPQREFLNALYRQDGQRLCTQAWGDNVRAAQCAGFRQGAWLLLREVPMVPPWQAPETWGELREALHRQGLVADELLRQALRPLRRHQSSLLVLLFPVVDRHGEPTVRLHAQALLAPRLSRSGNAQTVWSRDRNCYYRDRQGMLATDRPLLYRSTSNWHSAHITARGALPRSLQDARLLLIGAGALGSILGECLVRAGLRAVMIWDQDIVKVGNLTRHTATLADIQQFKANVVADRLRAASPHAQVSAHCFPFPPSTKEDQDLVQACDLVLDTTGSDALVDDLATFSWAGLRTFVSVSLSYGARHMFSYCTTADHFPADDFRAQFARHRPRFVERISARELPGEVIRGCWHPTFPARVDDVWLMASAAVKCIESAWHQRSAAASVVVLERQQDRDGICTLQRVS